MTTRLAINGFGRIGRNVLRALVESGAEDLKIVAINDLAPAANLAHLLKYDSVHGRFPAKVSHSEGVITVDGDDIVVTAERDPAQLPWKENNVDIVLECTGIFKSPELAGKHIEAGAKKVLISAPGSGVERTVVYGVNHGDLSKGDTIVSNASCTTNCLAPVAKVLDEAFGIVNGFMTTVHAYTGDQPTLDAVHKDLNRGRAAALSMIPTSTGAAKAISLVLPQLKGKIDGTAIRVPTPNVSAVDLVVNVEKETTVEEINAVLKAASESGPLKGVLAVSDETLVSSDFNHDPHSSTVMMDETYVNGGGKTLRILSWYDNEWGFSNRMLDNARVMANL